MLENFNANTELKFKELSPEEKQSRGILGRLYGPIASIVKATRNGRRYTESLWEKVFENPLTKEMFAQGGVPGELDHPVDREETCSEKIAIMMPEPPTKDKDGHLVGYFDIIDTPCGRIAYALAKYGFNLGISSRGSGDTYMDDYGEETVDEDTYSFNAFDLVLLPACKDARLQLAESLDVKKSKFNEAIQKELAKADEGAKKIMTETLENLKFIEDITPETEGEQDADEEGTEEVADNNGTDLVESLQKCLEDNRRLKKDVLDLQEKLSVSYTKEIKLVEENTKLKGAVKVLKESAVKAKALNTQLGTLKSQLDAQVQRAEKQSVLLEQYKAKLSQVGEARKSLSEGLVKRDSEIGELRQLLTDLNESIQTTSSQHKAQVESMRGEISELKADSEIRQKRYSQKLAQNHKLVESYKTIARKAVDKYIDSKAVTLGITTDEIKNRLSENYTFDDIDRVCESLRSYKRNLSKLPFNIGDIDRVALKEDTTTQRFTNPDDVVDQNLFNLLNS